MSESAIILATARDNAENPKYHISRELEAATLPRVLHDVDMALINTSYALEAGLNPVNDALFIEGEDSPYANLVATAEAPKDDAAVQKLVKALQSDEVRTFIQEKYKGSIVPAF